jgi:hypothetical protein
VATLAKRGALAALTLVGLVLLVLGLWFTSHLGSSGSGTFTARPGTDGVVVLDPTVLNRVDVPVRVTARAKDGGDVWMGRAAPSDAKAILGESARTTVTGVAVREWELKTRSEGTGEAPALAAADVWREQVDPTSTAELTIRQQDAPESLVIATPDGQPAALDSLTVTWQKGTWFFQSLVAALVGLLMAGAGAMGLWLARPRPTSEPGPESPADKPMEAKA